MQSLQTADAAVNPTAPPPPPPHHKLQILTARGAALRWLIRTAGVKADPEDVAHIVGVGPSFPAISGMSWYAVCDELPPSNDLVLRDIRDLVWALANGSLLMFVDGDIEDLEALHDL